MWVNGLLVKNGRPQIKRQMTAGWDWSLETFSRAKINLSRTTKMAVKKPQQTLGQLQSGHLCSSSDTELIAPTISAWWWTWKPTLKPSPGLETLTWNCHTFETQTKNPNPDFKCQLETLTLEPCLETLRPGLMPLSKVETLNWNPTPYLQAQPMLERLIWNPHPRLEPRSGPDTLTWNINLSP